MKRPRCRRMDRSTAPRDPQVPAGASASRVVNQGEGRARYNSSVMKTLFGSGL
jgi:hypothetical protein